MYLRGLTTRPELKGCLVNLVEPNGKWRWQFHLHRVHEGQEEGTTISFAPEANLSTFILPSDVGRREGISSRATGFFESMLALNRVCLHFG
jgi:hypothetical protein